MKQFIQRHIVLMGIVFIGALAGLGFVACTSDDDVIKPSETISAVDHTEIDHFKDMLSKTMEVGKEVDLTPSQEEVEAHVKGLPIVDTGGKKFEPVSRVYVEFTENNLSNAVKLDRLQKISTIEDVKNLVKEQNAIISVYANEYADGYVELSDKKALQILSPLIQESKQYLYGKGLSDVDIKSMLSENCCDESALIPFVLMLIEQQENENQIIEENGWCFNPVTGLIKTTDGQTVNPAKVDWQKAGYCALQALGITNMANDIVGMFANCSKQVLKRVFMHVASKMVGPAGVAIYVFAWSICYSGW